MGARLSRPLPPGEDAALRAEVNAWIDAERDGWPSHDAQQSRDVDWPRGRPPSAPRDAGERAGRDAGGAAQATELAAAAAAAAADGAAGSAGREQIVAQPPPAKTPKLLRSAKSDAIPPSKAPPPPDETVAMDTARSVGPRDSPARQPAPTKSHSHVIDASEGVSEAQASGPAPVRPKARPAAQDTQTTKGVEVTTTSTATLANARSAGAVSPTRTATGAFADERRGGTPNKIRRPSDAAAAQAAGLPRIPQKASASTAASASKATGVTAKSTLQTGERPPHWYTRFGIKSTRNPSESAASGSIDSIKGSIRKARSPGNAAAQQYAFTLIREGLHKLAFQKVSGQPLRSTRMLHNGDGLPQLFDPVYMGGVDFPWDIRADAEELYNTWAQQIFATELLRGIIPGKPRSGKATRAGDDSSQDRLDPAYTGRLSAAFHGTGLLLNGQRWPTQLAAVRDGAHGHSIAGIPGAKGEGAYSKDGRITENTQMMLDAERSGQPVRLIRSHNLKSTFAPELGFRYDGLSTVVSHGRLDPEESTRQRHQFRLQRLPDQTPLRGGDGPEARPTRQEIEEHEKDKRLRGFK